MEAGLPFSIAAQKERLVADLQKLISFDTSLPPGEGYPEITAWLAEQVEELGFITENVAVPEDLWNRPSLGFHGPRVNVVARRKLGRPPLSIYAHLDVVPAGPGWSVPPFQGVVKDGRIYGRGAGDMKGTIASLLAALRALKAAGRPLAFDPILLFCTDEEGGSYPGIRYLAERGYVEGHLLCMDGQAAPRRWAGCCGMVDYRITVQGRGGHSGGSDETVNAIESAVPVLQSLLELKSRVESRASGMPAAPRERRSHVHARLNVTVFHGGTKPNVIPAECELWVNRRYLPEESLETVLAELEAAARVEGVTVGLDGPAAHLPPVLDPLGPHWPRWEAALAHGFGFRLSDFVRYGASSSSDMGWVQMAGIQEILLGGVSRPDSNIHGPDEWAAIDDLLGLAQALAVYLSDQTASST